LGEMTTGLRVLPWQICWQIERLPYLTY